jgi:hypothetical protein
MLELPAMRPLWAAILAGALSSAAWAEPGLAGHWRGMVAIRPAQYEVGLDATFKPRSEGGALSGLLSFTTNGQFDLVVHDIVVSPPKLRFAVTDESGIVSTFVGTLSPDGARLRGELEESGKSYGFELRRETAPTAPPAVELRSLSAGGGELRDDFNQHLGNVRLLLLVSPTCPQCKSVVGMVQRYVLQAIPDPRLTVYVVWEPVLPKDNAEQAKATSSLFSDPRLVQFWAPSLAAGQQFASVVGTHGTPVWDLFMVFPGDAKWQESPPAPGFVMSNLADDTASPKHPRLQAVELADKVRVLLAGTSGTK